MQASGTFSDPPLGVNGLLTAQGILGSLCLLGISSSSNSPWMAYPAAGVFLYTILFATQLWRLVSPFGVARLFFAWAPRVVGFFVAAAASMVLADGPMPVAAVGSIGVLTLVASVAGGAVLVAARSAYSLALRVRGIAIGQRVRAVSQLAWLAITQ